MWWLLLGLGIGIGIGIGIGTLALISTGSWARRAAQEAATQFEEVGRGAAPRRPALRL
ncbi:hypothetical protein AB0I22_14045 [Streptomyces sp. NPDC050610]|uniref:hypothetical protein n=1 Tax=Streptomyces sp. NPDC050610 TaxID=3157097 RepID=UPI0034471CB9